MCNGNGSNNNWADINTKVLVQSNSETNIADDMIRYDKTIIMCAQKLTDAS